MMQPLRLAGLGAGLGLALAGLATGASAQQDDALPPASRTEASQIEMPQASGSSAAGRAYLDESGRPATAAQPRASLVQTAGGQISRGDSNAPASQISARGQGGPGMTQLSKVDLDATLAQLSPAERQVLLQAIEGTDICDNPPDVPAIQALCLNRIETRSGEFANLAPASASAEDQLLRGNLESTSLPSVAQVIERLARGGASSGDFSNQAIASIALGSNPTIQPAPPREEKPESTAGLGEEAQALINALINQLGGGAP